MKHGRLKNLKLSARQDLLICFQNRGSCASTSAKPKASKTGDRWRKLSRFPARNEGVPTPLRRTLSVSLHCVLCHEATFAPYNLVPLPQRFVGFPAGVSALPDTLHRVRFVDNGFADRERESPDASGGVPARLLSRPRLTSSGSIKQRPCSTRSIAKLGKRYLVSKAGLL